ncbi:hypothetical protein EVAR_59782_1 [Eumeta japonica]|uniref:Uncharacterized protein n=1 Tax=Eumeta variegata TaxID=151549 RepID=A0A4C1YC26_EUMVA|nr:hypothetical protein EVAR_59782_1 [Eumeta japonica]
MEARPRRRGRWSGTRAARASVYAPLTLLAPRETSSCQQKQTTRTNNATVCAPAFNVGRITPQLRIARALNDTPRRCHCFREVLLSVSCRSASSGRRGGPMFDGQ